MPSSPPPHVDRPDPLAWKKKTPTSRYFAAATVTDTRIARAPFEPGGRSREPRVSLFSAGRVKNSRRPRGRCTGRRRRRTHSRAREISAAVTATSTRPRWKWLDISDPVEDGHFFGPRSPGNRRRRRLEAHTPSPSRSVCSQCWFCARTALAGKRAVIIINSHARAATVIVIVVIIVITIVCPIRRAIFRSRNKIPRRFDRRTHV